MKRKYGQINKIIGSTLQTINMYSKEAQQLLLITGATESRYEYLKQYPSGPASSWWQIEELTNWDVWHNWLRFRGDARERVIRVSHLSDKYMKELPNHALCTKWATDIIPYAICMARIVYRRVPKALPAYNDIDAMGAYYLKYYNAGGKGTIKKWFEGYDLVK